jgi:hypothetical protein
VAILVFRAHALKLATATPPRKSLRFIEHLKKNWIRKLQVRLNRGADTSVAII